MDQRVDRAEALCVLCIDLFCDLGPNAPIIGEGEFHLVVEQIEPVEDRIWVRGIGRLLARPQAIANSIVRASVAMVSPKMEELGAAFPFVPPEIERKKGG